MTAVIINGGQYGSEGKGVIADLFSPTAEVAIRVGGSNAGHTIRHDGRTWKMRMVPCAWTNPATTLVLGPGAIVDVPVLREEVDALEAAGYSIRNRLFIDRKATLQVEGDSAAEHATAGDGKSLVERMGSTGKGIGAARIRRIKRLPELMAPVRDLTEEFTIADTPRIYRPLAVNEGNVVIEGTQGFGLSLTHGPWPYVTSTDLTTTQLLNDCALPASTPLINIMVFRTMPIRVAGNSGPLKGETSWEALSDILGKEVEERTTVTNKVRRIGEFDWELAHEAVAVNAPHMIALTFADYLDPNVEACPHWNTVMGSPAIRQFVNKIEGDLGVPVWLIGTGGPEFTVARHPALAAMLSGGPRKR